MKLFSKKRYEILPRFARSSSLSIEIGFFLVGEARVLLCRDSTGPIGKKDNSYPGREKHCTSYSNV